MTQAFYVQALCLLSRCTDVCMLAIVGEELDLEDER